MSGSSTTRQRTAPWSTPKRGRVVAELPIESEHEGPWYTAPSAGDRVLALDKSVSKAMWAGVQGIAFARPVGLLLEYSGHGVPWFAGAIGWLAWAWWWSGTAAVPDEQVLWTLFAFNVGLLLDVACVALIKLAFQRQRPPYNKGHVAATLKFDRFSFPSGHSSRGAFVATFLIAHAIGGEALQAAALAWALVLALSRVLIGRHYLG